MNSTDMFLATCNVVYNVDWFGSYNLVSMHDQDVQFISKVKTLGQYISLIIDIIKEGVLKKVTCIHNIKWHINAFNDTITLHCLIKEVLTKLVDFIKIKLTNSRPCPSNNIHKSIIISITNDDDIIFASTIFINI